MKHLFVKSVAGLIALLSLAAAAMAGPTHPVTDNLGNTVEVPIQVNRVAVAGIFPLPSVLTVYLGSPDKIVGIPPVSMKAAQAGLLGELFPVILKADTSYTTGEGSLNVEQLLRLKPDVVFYSSGNKQWGEMLRNAGLPALAVSPRAWNYDVLKTYDGWIGLLDQVFSGNDKSARVSAASKVIYDRIQKVVGPLSPEKRAKVLFIFRFGNNQIFTSGQHFFGQWWANAVGAVNVAQSVTVDNAALVTMEQIYAWNPDVIFITNFTQLEPQDIYDGKAGTYDWNALSAVKNHRVYKMPLGIYRTYTPGTDTPLTLLWMAQKVYPDLFKDVDMAAETRRYYKNLFGLNLTNAQIKAMYNPSRSAAAFNR